VDVGAALVADAEAAVLVQPDDRALDHPALGAEPGAVWLLGPADLAADAAGAQLVPVPARVVGAVAEQALRAAAGTAALAAHRRDRVDQRQQLTDVVVVGARQRQRQRGAPSRS
jgi:hypothetical protein